MNWYLYSLLIMIGCSPITLIAYWVWKRNRRGKEGQYLDKWKAMTEDDNISYYRTGKEVKRTITIYRGMLTNDQKEQLDTAERTLFELAESVEEESKIYGLRAANSHGKEGQQEAQAQGSLSQEGVAIAPHQMGFHIGHNYRLGINQLCVGERK